MAEAAAAIGLVASIALLIDLGAKVVSRLHDFASKTADVPESFRSLSNRWPLLTSTLQFVTLQAQAGRLPHDVITALRSLIQSTATQVSVVDTCLSQITSPIDASRVPQEVRALESLAKDGAIRTAVEKIHQDIDFLVLHQTTQQHVDKGDRILETLASLQLAPVQSPSPSPVARRGHDFPSVAAHGHSTVHLGDVYHFDQYREPDEVKTYGLCLGPAPLINPNDFIGRAAELNHMKQILRPDETICEQRRLVLGGMGGIGKTQLAIAYARLCQACYTSLFWLNATTELTLKEGIRSIARRLLKAPELEKLDDDTQSVLRAHDWLSDTRNTQWLLIFDNYDDPDQFPISDYVPNSAHGSIIITTRRPDLVSGQHVRVQPISALGESLEILQTRSQRDNVKNDPDARRLAERLAGLPLALVTAGAYLRKTTLSFREYLVAYDQRFSLHPRRPIHLHEYQDRTLDTTWNMSYTRLESDDPLAAKALRVFAYFDNQEIWYELLHAGLTDDLPVWLHELAAEQVDFEVTMGTLVDYCLLEVHTTTRSYSIHNCVHDWVSAKLNDATSHQLYWYAVKCIVANIDKNDWESLGRLRYARLARHASRCAHRRFEQSLSLDAVLLDCINEVAWLAELLARQLHLSAAEKMYIRALTGREKELGPDHISTLDTVHNLGLLYYDQGKLDEAKQMYIRALTAKEKAPGSDHISTLDKVHNLGSLYRAQGKLDEAEQMYMRALAGKEKALGPNHTSTLDIIHNLGSLHRAQGKLDEAEQMYMRALAGKEKALGPDHTSTLETVNNLGNLYRAQGKLDEAEQMYIRALAGREKERGPDHTSTLNTVNGLGNLYCAQGRLDEAEQMYMRALVGREKALGPDHTTTLNMVNNLGSLYRAEGKLNEAEQMYIRALAGKEKTLGPDHTTTLNTVDNLGSLYRVQGKLDEAEQMYIRALAGKEKAQGPDHTSTLETVNNLGNLYRAQGKLDEAEQMYIRALAGRKKALGPDHTSTLNTVNKLGNLYLAQGRLDEAEQMYTRALAGREKALGPDHTSTLDMVNNLGDLYRAQGKQVEAEQMYMRALDSFRRTLRDNNSPLRAAISGFAASLSASIRRGGVNDSITQSRLFELSDHVRKWGQGNLAIVDWLGRALIGVKDEQNAQLAFRFSVRYQNNDIADFGWTYCDGCKSRITVSMGRHICRECDNADLCESCLSKHETNTLAWTKCRGHSFFPVDTTGLGTKQSLAAKGDVGFDIWIENVIKQYSKDSTSCPGFQHPIRSSETV